MTQNWHILTLFPEFFSSPLSCGLLGKAIENKILSVQLINPRNFSGNPHGQVDERPYGGGAGMVMQVGPLARALRSIENPGKILLLSPRGKIFNENYAHLLADEKDIILVCGRYEGIDERLGEIFPLSPICTGPYILNGGETAALSVIEATARLLPGFMGKMKSAEAESFSDGLLEYPHYTRPEIYEDRAVPRVLLEGDHAKIAQWRRQQALITTLNHNPSLFAESRLLRDDVKFLKTVPRKRAAANFSFCLMHYPVILEKDKIGASSLTNLDVHDIGRISYSYGMASFYVVTPLKDQLDILYEILRHWTEGAGGKSNSDRKKALETVCPMNDFSAVVADMENRTGRRPYIAASSAAWPQQADRLITVQQAREISNSSPFLFCLGTARGLAPEFIDTCDGILQPIRFLSENHLSVRAAAAIIADRIFGDYY